MTEIKFFDGAGNGLFVRSDMEDGHWVQEEMSVTATFPYDAEKVIQSGYHIALADPATGSLEVFEIRKVTNIEPEHYQQITAEHIVISELSDEHINSAEIDNKTPAQALAQVLTGTLWSVGNVSAVNVSSCDISRGDVWQAVNTIMHNWNVYIVPRVTLTGAGGLSGRYLDIIPAHGTFRGVRLSIEKNMADSSVEYDDSEVLTALYGYGGATEHARSGQDDDMQEITFAEVTWTATADHPAKPSGQIYLEWPEKTAIYGRGESNPKRPRFGYYQNGQIKDPDVLLEKTWEALKKTAEPKISISGTVADLYRLGYADEPLRLHDTAIVEIRETGEVFQKEIIKLDIDLIDPSANRPEIGDYIPNIVYINRETASRASGGGGGGSRGQTNAQDAESNTFTLIEKNESLIGLVAGTKNGNQYIKAAEIAVSINNSTGESIAIVNADRIRIGGPTSTITLGDIMNLTATNGMNVLTDAAFALGLHSLGTVTSEAGFVAEDSYVRAENGFKIDQSDTPATWQSQYVVTSVTPIHTNKYTWHIDEGTGKWEGTLCKTVSPNGTTIHYLGY